MLKNVEEILAGHELCDHCLGRLFGKRSHGLTNEERGKSLRTSLAIAKNEPIENPNTCEVCSGLWSSLDTWVDRCLARVEGLEFNTFLFGSRIDDGMVERQSRLVSESKLSDSEGFSHAINRELGKLFRDRLAEKGVEVRAEFDEPDLTLLVDFRTEEIDLTIRPVYIYGRYRKLARGVPQTIWHCKNCRGSGCEECSFTGRVYEDSVAERISLPLKEVTGGKSWVFHGAGREDVDVKMLGSGRPFIVEVEEPAVRSLDLESVAEKINETSTGIVEVSRLKSVGKDAIKEIKGSGSDKIYRINLELEKAIPEEDFRRAVGKMEGRIFQRTPDRVSHRRANRIRVRRLKSTTVTKLSETEYEVVLVAESGLYVKELFTSQRTQPSLTRIIGTPIKVTGLDVLDIPGNLETLDEPEDRGTKYLYRQSEEDVKKSFVEFN